MDIRKSLIIFLSTFGVILTGCNRGEKAAGPVRKTIRVSDTIALQQIFAELLKRPEGSFVIIEEPTTGKFVQLGGSRKEALFLDLPKQTLSDQEMGRAKTLFSELGVAGPEVYDVYDLQGKVAGKQIAFQMELDRDTTRAAEITSSIFQRVYRFRGQTTLEARIDVGVTDADLKATGVEAPEE